LRGRLVGNWGFLLYCPKLDSGAVMLRVLFVCMGNICRSPMAEAVFADLVDRAGLSAQFEIDSAGRDSYHVGQRPCPGTLHMLEQVGLPYDGRSRRVTAHDVTHFDYLIALDSYNQRDLRRMAGQANVPATKIHRLLDFAPEINARDVPDTYYTGNFGQAYQMILAGCRGLLAHTIEMNN